MRFLKDGPSIPDNLLLARDEGKVVFFCGAGVSKERAGLLDFFGLAAEVIQELHVPHDSPAHKILKESREIAERTGVSGLISADRIFSLLERDFLERDIEAAVASALRPGSVVDLSAHQILLDLATTTEGKVRLVTTNFDRLFEECRDALNIWKPPRLPDPSSDIEMDGIIHLHGCVTKDYTGADGDRLILSSSEFGRAYLSEGWATQFVREIIARSVVVFVGYAAEDPPVLYLLEALNKKDGKLDGVYAFQAGLDHEAAAKWQHKGVEAIPYIESAGHQRLWDTLAAWAERAKDPDKWYKGVIDQAKKGPAKLQTHERGQVAHIISTLEGARKFSEGDDPPPAEWLCVFDPQRRYARPGHTGDWNEEGPFVDPFNLYGLDSDIAPKPIDPDKYHEKRDIPTGAWDGLAATRRDRQNINENSYSSIRGHWAMNIPSLLPRLFAIGIWIGRVAAQPAAIWWAACQGGLHPDIKRQIQRQIEYNQEDVGSKIRKAWRYIIEMWDEHRNIAHRDWHELKATIDKDGWDRSTIRRFAALNRPWLKVEQYNFGGPIPPSRKKDIEVRDMLSMDVEYPEPIYDIRIPDEWLAPAVRELRRNLEHAMELETDLGGYGLNNISPLVPNEPPQHGSYGRPHGLSASVRSFAAVFARLIKFDSALAKQEFESWPADDDTIFCRLRIWAAGKNEIASPATFCTVIESLSEDAFWSNDHQRDLLLVLARRWGDLSEQTKKKIEAHLLGGPAKWDGEEAAEFDKRRAWRSLSRIHWLANNGCVLSFDLEIETERLTSIVPEWKPEYAAKAAESYEGRGGMVETRTEYAALLNEPIGSILTKALELSGRKDDFLVDHAPFTGLSAEKPVLALSALTHAAKRGEYPEWAWHVFLSSESRKSDKPKVSAYIVERISRYSNDAVANFIRPVTAWVLTVSKDLSSSRPKSFDKIILKLIDVLRTQSQDSNSGFGRQGDVRDWATEALNSPSGNIARALFHDPRIDKLEIDEGFPAKWLVYADSLLSLSDDLRRHALTIFSRNMKWFYNIDPQWTEINIVSILEKGDEQDRRAIWSGFLGSARVPYQKLLRRLRPLLLTLAKQASSFRLGYEAVLAGIILTAWGNIDEETGARFISNEEMHDTLLNADDEFRTQVLWHLERFADNEDDAIAKPWATKVPELLRDVWPRQKSVKSPRMSARLCHLAFSNAERFCEITEIVLPLLTPVDTESITLPNLRRDQGNIVALYPERTLALLHRVLPDNVSFWPYSIGDILQRIAEADERLLSDDRLTELNRKWSAK